MSNYSGASGIAEGVWAGLGLIAIPFVATLLGIHVGWYVAGRVPLYGLSPPMLLATWVYIFLIFWAWVPSQPEGLVVLALIFASAWCYWWRERFRREAFIAIVAVSAPLGWGHAGRPPLELSRLVLAALWLGVLYAAIRLVPVLAWWWARRHIPEEVVEQPEPPPTPPTKRPSPPPLTFIDDRDDEAED